MDLAQTNSAAAPLRPTRVRPPRTAGGPPGVHADEDPNFATLAHTVVTLVEAPQRSGVAQRGARGRRLLIAGDVLGATAGVLLVYGMLGALHPALAVLVLVALALTRLLKLHARDELVLTANTLDDLPKLFEVACFTTLVAWVADPLVGGHDLTSGAGAGLVLALLAGLVLGRICAREAIVRGSGPERCLLVGDEDGFGLLQRKLQGLSRDRAEVVALLPLDRSPAGWSGIDLYGALDDMRGLIERLDIDRIIVAPTASDSASTLEMIRLAKATGVKVSIVPRLFEVVGSSVEFEAVEGLPMLAVRRFGLSGPARAIKRAFDLGLGLLAFVLAAPIMALIAIVVRRTSPGPILFKQARIGTNGREFCVYKFRTMVEDAETKKRELVDANETVGLFKIAEDPRITPVGRLLRRSSLDELPQILNVIRGEMSLVGPRPLIPEEDGQISGWNRRRLELKPGMTGPWQVMPTGRIPLQEMAAIDYLYAANWTLWTDVKIMSRTVGYVFAAGGR